MTAFQALLSASAAAQFASAASPDLTSLLSSTLASLRDTRYSMILRRGTVTDAGPIAELIASFQSELTIDPSGAGADEFLASVSENAEREYLESPRYFYIVAEKSGKIAGFVAIRDYTHLYHLFVARPFHRNGLASRLWHEAREEAVHRGNPGEFTVNSSLNAIAVYKAFGFLPSAPVTTMHGISFLPMRLSQSAHEA